MINVFVDRFMAGKSRLEELFKSKHPESYEEIVRGVIGVITDDEYKDFSPDPDRIHVIDDGDYLGTLLFVIAQKGYQPSEYYYVKVDYGSCSGCDTLESIRTYDDKKPTNQQVDDYMTLALHIVQGIKVLDEEE